MRIDYIIDPTINHNSHATLLRAADRSREILARILPEIQTVRREGDTNELANIRAAILHTGQLNTARFAESQRDDRREYQVPDDELSMLITDRPLIDQRPNGRQNMFGVTYIPTHESVASLARYL